MNDSTDEGHRDDFHRGGKSDSRVLGEDVFLETALSHAEWRLGKKPGLDAVIRAIAGLYRLTDEEFSAKGQGMRISEARSMAAWAVQELTDASLTELAKRIGRDVTSLSSAVTRLLKRSKSDEKVDYLSYI